jgi:hypothetical protein
MNTLEELVLPQLPNNGARLAPARRRMIGFQVSEEMDARLRQSAAALNVPIADVVRVAVDRLFKEADSR